VHVQGLDPKSQSVYWTDGLIGIRHIIYQLHESRQASKTRSLTHYGALPNVEYNIFLHNEYRILWTSNIHF